VNREGKSKSKEVLRVKVLKQALKKPAGLKNI
jgi:hypothetical protein